MLLLEKPFPEGHYRVWSKKFIPLGSKAYGGITDRSLGHVCWLTLQRRRSSWDHPRNYNWPYSNHFRLSDLYSRYLERDSSMKILMWLLPITSMFTQERFCGSIWSVNHISTESGLHNLTVRMRALRWPQLTGITMHEWSFLCLVVCFGNSTPSDGFGVTENPWAIHTGIIITKMSSDTWTSRTECNGECHSHENSENWGSTQIVGASVSYRSLWIS